MLQSFSLFCCCASTFSVCVLAGKQLIGAQNLFVSNCAAYHLDLHLCEYSNLDIKPLFSCSFTLICKYILSSLFHQPYWAFTTGFRTILIHLIEKEHSSFFFSCPKLETIYVRTWVGHPHTHTQVDDAGIYYLHSLQNVDCWLVLMYISTVRGHHFFVIVCRLACEGNRKIIKFFVAGSFPECGLPF